MDLIFRLLLCKKIFSKISCTILLSILFLNIFAPGKAQNNALSFDGINDYVAVPALGNNLTQFTIETWINASSTAISPALNGIFNTNTWVLGDVHFQINNVKVQLAVNGSTTIDVPYNAITVNTWHHLAVTYNSVTKKINVYINGALLQSATLATTVSANFTAAEIGAWTSQRYFAGIMDEYRIWNTERTFDEIKNNMFSSMTGTESGLLASFSFNQGTAGGTNTGINILVNAKGSNNGTLTNFALSGVTSNWVSGFKPAPVSHVTSFTGSLVSNKMTLTWTDATGTIIPDGYLIYASKTNSFTNPVDGVLPADDNDLTDGTGIVRVAKGIQTYNGWINEDFNTTWYFKIYSLTNPGLPVKYFTSGTVPQIQLVSKQILTQVASNFPRFTNPSWFDYDNDGYIDILIGLDIGERTSLYRNNRNNTFSYVTSFNSPGFDIPAGLVDFDLNGFLDVTGGSTSNVYFNNSGVSFTAAPSSNAGLPKITGEWADFDNDADNDFLTRASNGYSIKIYRRDASVYNELFGNSFRPCDGILKWIDYNNDGYPDIFATGKNQLDGKLYSTLYKNEGNGKFSEQTQINLPVLEGGSVNIADINSDGRMDILLTGNKTDNSGTVVLCTNNGGINFTTHTIAGFYSFQNRLAPVVDIDNDGLSDILISANTSDTEGIVKIFRNNGNGTFSDLYIQNFTSSGPGLGIFDVNNDGNVDLVEGWDKVFQNTVTSSNLPPNKITTASSALEGNGVRLNWSATDDKTPAAGLTYELRIGTGPGASNIMAASSIGNGTRKLLTTGNMGTSTSKFLQLPKGTYYWSVQAIDNSFKGGAFSDEKSFTIVDVPASNLTAKILNEYSLNLIWTKGNGTKRAVFCKIGTSGTASPIVNKTYIGSNIYGDGDQIGTSGWYCVYNGTGDSVVVNKLSSSYSYVFHVFEYSGNSGSENYMLVSGNGNPGVFSTSSFSLQPEIPLTQSGQNPKASYYDFNNDGFLDISLYDEYPYVYDFSTTPQKMYNHIRIFKNKGNNTFEEQVTTLPKNYFGSIAWADYDNDGNAELVTCGYYPGQYSGQYNSSELWEVNNGIAEFKQTLTAMHNGFLTWGDYNNDGNIDLVIGGQQGSVGALTTLYKNSGAPDYTLIEQTGITITGVRNGAAKWSDYNIDGWPDLIIAGTADDGSYIIKLFENDKNNGFLPGQTLMQFTGLYNQTSLECSDLNKDGYPDLVWSAGNSSFSKDGKTTIFYNNGNKTFSSDNNSFSLQDAWNSFDIGDYNNDYTPDVVFSGGEVFSHPFKRLYQNGYPEKKFSINSDFNPAYSEQGSVLWGDYDNDGDMDLLASAQIKESDYYSYVDIIRNNLIMKAGTFTANRLPAAPVNIQTSLKPGQLVITWDKITTDETLNLSYNVMLKKGSQILNAPNSDPATGRRFFTENGNSGLNNFAIFKELPVGTYSISVQAVDGAFAGGAWSAPVTVEIKNTKAFFTFDTVCYKVATKLSDLSTSTKNIASRKWKYNNRVFSTDSVAYFVFPHSGTDNITLVITDGEGMIDSITHVIKIKERPNAAFSATTVCLGSTTAFVNNSSRNGAGTVTWNWNYDNGDPASADSIPLNKVYGLAKTYNTKLIVTASNGCADTLAKEVIVGAFPNSLTSVNGKTVFCQGDSLILSVENNPLYNYQWKLDNIELTNSNASSLTVKSNSGGYSVKITNPLANCAANSAQTMVTVDPKPAAPFISESGSVQFCQGDSVVLSAPGNTGYDYQWKLNGGEAGSGSNQFVAKNGGTYSLLVTNSKGCSANSTNNINVTVNTKPVLPTVNISGPTTFCEGSSVELSVASVSGYTYQWEKNNSGIAGASSNTLTAQNSGIYSLRISNPAGCYIKTENTTVNVLTAPDAPTIQESGPLTFCEGSSVILSITGTSGYSYQWKLNGGDVGTNSDQYTAKSSGRYSLVVSNGNCSVTSANIIDITVKPLPVVSDINLVGSDKFCKGGKATLSVPLNSNYTYSWKKGTDYLQLNTNSIDAAESGEYYAEVSLTGCKVATAPRRIEVVEKPAKPDIDKGSYFVDKCLNENPLILSVENMVSGYSYQWYKNETPISNSSSIEVMESGNYYLEAVVDICPSERALAEIKLKNPLAKPDIFVKGPAVWIVSTTADAKYYNWYYNGSIVQRDNKNVYVAGQKMGTYRVSISNDNDCFVFSNTIGVPSGITGIEDTDPFEGVKIYPNPTSGLFTIDMDNNIFGELFINIFSQTGSKVLSIKFDKTTEHFSSEIDLSGQSKGMYLINLSLDKFRAVRKVLVE